MTLLEEVDELRKLRMQADRRAEGNLPAFFHEMFGDLIANPKGWPVVRVEEAGNIQPGRGRALKQRKGHFTRPCVGAANLSKAGIDARDLTLMGFDKRDFERYRLEHGDILLNERQTAAAAGKPAMWRNEVPDCYFQHPLVRFRPDPERVLPDFALAAFLAYFGEGKFTRTSKTSSVAHPGWSRLAKMPLPLPPLSLQQEFAARADEIRAMEGGQAASRERLEDLFQSLL